MATNYKVFDQFRKKTMLAFFFFRLLNQSILEEE